MPKPNPYTQQAFISLMQGKTAPKKKVHPKRKPRTTKNKMEEKLIEKRIILALNLAGYKAGKRGENSTYNSHLIMDGNSDIECYVPYYGVIHLEVKTATGKQLPSQIEFEKLCILCNEDYFVVRSPKEALDYVNMAHMSTL